MKTFAYIYSLIVLFLAINVHSQVGIGTNTPSGDAILELNSTNKGMLFNKLALQNTNSASPLSAHQVGMWVYNTATAGTYPNNVIPGLYYNDGTKWILISYSESQPRIGDIKSNFTSIDHNGWYLLNGRNISAITPTNAQTNAVNLGFTTAIPNATDRIIKGKSTSENLSVQGGSNLLTITQSNLPSHTISGTTNTTGAHTHTLSLVGDQLWHVNTNNPTVNGLKNLQTQTRSTTSNGDHNHTISVPSGGLGTAIANYPKNMAVNYFIYLGK